MATRKTEVQSQVTVFRQELPAYPLRAVFDEAAEALGEEGLATLLQTRGVTRAELEDPLVWVSLEFVEWLFDEIAARGQEPDFLGRAAARAMTAKYIGPLYPLFVSLGTPLFTYRQLPKAASRITKLARWELGEARRGFVRLVWAPNEGSPRERTRSMCRFRRAQLTRIPTLFGLPIARVDHPRCLLDGHDQCVYEVSWSELPPRRHAVLGLLCGLLAGLSLGALGTVPPWYVGLLSLATGAAGWGLGRAFVLREELRARTREIDEHNQALDRVMHSNEQRYAELLEAKAEVDLKVEQRTEELRQATEQLSATLQQVQALDKAKTDFFNNVSHELRSPLTLILAPLDDMAEGRPPPGGEHAALAAMRHNAARLLQLINQLLDLAKVDAGQMKISPVSTDLLELVRAVVTRFEGAAAKKGVALRIETPSALAPIGIDAAWIESAITNLVANALRFTSAGGAVRVSLADRGSEMLLAVSDDGPGISSADQIKVFERFAQGDTSKGVVGGTGIGLALVREAARLHGGDVKLVSELGKGSTFTITLPRRADYHAEAPASPRPNAAPITQRIMVEEIGETTRSVDRPAPNPHAPLALVVEDNPELRNFVADVLATNYRVRTAKDGKQGLVLAQELKPDVVVSDVAMPEMNGYDLCRALRADDDTRTIPILMVTARTDVASVLEGFEAGANDYVLKPFHGRELLARVDVHVRLRRMVQEFALRERHAALGVLAASVAHQVRNPLTTLISGLPAMQGRMKDKVDPRTADLMAVMIDCATRIERVSLDLMDLSRVDREEGGDYRPSDGLRSAVRMLQARAARITVEEKVDEAPLIHGRVGDMNHVFLNLLDNAVRAAGNSGQVRVEGWNANGSYFVRVGDSGPGISAEMAARIFEPFFTTRQAGEGTGLGLAIARQVVQHAGGDIVVERSELGGAAFVVRIPMSRRRSLSPRPVNTN